MISDRAIWLTILLLGGGTYLIRLSFLALVGSRDLPDWVQRHLRYVPVAVIPGLLAPLLAWPAATGGHPDPVRLTGALVALVVGIRTRSSVWAVGAGMAALYLGLGLF